MEFHGIECNYGAYEDHSGKERDKEFYDPFFQVHGSRALLQGKFRTHPRDTEEQRHDPGLDGDREQVCGR
jgi:hypothetical protein